MESTLTCNIAHVLEVLIDLDSPKMPTNWQDPRIAKSSVASRDFRYLAPPLWKQFPTRICRADTFCAFKTSRHVFLTKLIVRAEHRSFHSYAAIRQAQTAGGLPLCPGHVIFLILGRQLHSRRSSFQQSFCSLSKKKNSTGGLLAKQMKRKE